MYIFTEYFAHKVTFEMGKAFNRTYKQRNETHHWQHHCTRISRVSLECDTIHDDWNLNTNFVFNSTGVVEHKRNKDKNVATKKTYQRVSTPLNRALQNLKEGITEIKGNNQIMDGTIESDIDAWE